MILHFSLRLFHFKHYRSRCRSRWENLDRGQYLFQPIKFVNLVVPRPCETEPYNNRVILTSRVRASYSAAGDCCIFKFLLRNVDGNHLMRSFSERKHRVQISPNSCFFEFFCRSEIKRPLHLNLLQHLYS